MRSGQSSRISFGLIPIIIVVRRRRRARVGRDARALTHADLYALPRVAFERLIRDYPGAVPKLVDAAHRYTPEVVAHFIEQRAYAMVGLGGHTLRHDSLWHRVDLKGLLDAAREAE